MKVHHVSIIYLIQDDHHVKESEHENEASIYERVYEEVHGRRYVK